MERELFESEGKHSPYSMRSEIDYIRSAAISLKRIADALEDIVRGGAPINVDHRPI